MKNSINPMNGTPLVSIITPSFNQAQYIEDTIKSVLNQDSHQRIEHIIIDGGSTDGTVEILKRYGDHIRWISEPDNGQSEAINKGFRIASGDIFGWMNADDFYAPGAIRAAVSCLIAHPDLAMVHGEGHYVDQDGRLMMTRHGGDFGLARLLAVNTIMSIAVFFRKSVLDQIGFLDESLHYVMDWEYWVRMAMKGLKMKYIPEPVFAYSREHSGSKTIQVKEHFWKERFLVFERIFNSKDTPLEIKRLKKQSYSGVYASSAFFYLRYGEIAKAVAALVKAIRIWPGVLFIYNPLLVIKNLWTLVKGNRCRIVVGDNKM